MRLEERHVRPLEGALETHGTEVDERHQGGLRGLEGQASMQELTERLLDTGLDMSQTGQQLVLSKVVQQD